MSVRSSRFKRSLKCWARRLLATASRGLRGAAGDRLSPGLRILTYHRVSCEPEDPFAVLPADFARQMEAITESQVAVGLDQALSELEADTEIASRIAITFDDGTVDFLSEVMPVVTRLGLPATLYVNPSRVGTPGFLGWDNLLEVSAAGIDIGSHCVDHRSLGSLRPDEVRRQVQDSRSILEDRLGRRVTSLAYPFGTIRDFNARTREEVALAGYRSACTSINGLNRRDADLLELRRTKIERGDGPIFSWILAGSMDGWAFFDRYFSFLQNRYA